MAGKQKHRQGTPQSISIRLNALADLAERAANQIWIVRVVVLWILHFAEHVIGEFVVNRALDAGLDEVIEQLGQALNQRDDDDSRAEALRLAMSFRALAMLLTFMDANGLCNWREDRRFGAHSAQTRLECATALIGFSTPADGFSLLAQIHILRPEVRWAALPGYS